MQFRLLTSLIIGKNQTPYYKTFISETPHLQAMSKMQKILGHLQVFWDPYLGLQKPLNHPATTPAVMIQDMVTYCKFEFIIPYHSFAMFISDLRYITEKVHGIIVIIAKAFLSSDERC